MNLYVLGLEGIFIVVSVVRVTDLRFREERVGFKLYNN